MSKKRKPLYGMLLDEVAQCDVPIPISADQAETMVKMGWMWLQLHAPERIGKTREHWTSADCWCCPDVDYVDPDTGVKVYVHKRPA